jgi:hypothetical protein
MTQKTPNEAGQVDEIQKQINQALEELDRIRNQRQSITTPAELQAAEQAIIEATDKIAALMTGLKIQQALDSDDLKEKATPVHSCNLRAFKNQPITDSDSFSPLHTPARRRRTQAQFFTGLADTHPQFLDGPVGKYTARHSAPALLAP